MRFIALFIIFNVTLHAADFGGVSSSPLPTRSIGEGLSFSVAHDGPKEELHWKITKSLPSPRQGSYTMGSGEVVRPGESYAYFWDEKKGMLWFATARVLMSTDLSGFPPVSSSHVRSTKGFEGYKDLPAGFREKVTVMVGRNLHP